MQTCEQKNEILANALTKLIKKDVRDGIAFIKLYINLQSFLIHSINFVSDCSTCFNDILIAVTDCFFSGTWLQCVEDVLGAGNPCIECVCEVIGSVCSAIGCDFHC